MHIQVDSLSFTYPGGVVALQGVSLGITAGLSLAIIGQNGAGKTTLVKHLNGLLKPTSGSVYVGDWDTRNFSPAKLASRVGYVFQNPDDQLFQSSVRKEVMFGPKNLGWEPEKVSEQTEKALEMVALTVAAERHPYDLSPGERKRAALASVLAMDTPVIVLDEPTTGQDHSGIELVGEIVEHLKERDKTVITITHDIDFCAEHFERVAAMAEGKLLIEGPTREVLAEEDLLAETYVDPPQLMRLAKRLQMKHMPLNVDEFISEYFEKHT
jgi:energy-coupling factor transport system ATP-binding protein